MQFGIFTSASTQNWPGIVEFWQHLERSGWDIACVTDHFMPNNAEREGAVIEGWSTLCALAPLVPRMTLGTIVLGNTYRHPAVLAKMAAQLDIITGGRLLLGMGAGWQENEHVAYGIPYYTLGERLARLDEACTVMRSLWTGHRSNFDGKYYQLSNAPLQPKPLQSPHPKLMIGGGGEKVTLRIVAKHADHWNVWGGPKVAASKGAVLDRHCADLGRDAGELSRSANMVLRITDKQSEIQALGEFVGKRMGPHAADPHDSVLAGSAEQIRDKLTALQAAGIDTVFLPNMFSPADVFKADCDEFITNIAKDFR